MVGPYYNNLQKINPYRVEHAATTDVVNDTTTARKMIIKLSDVLIY
jgi:hypothetical protein